MAVVLFACSRTESELSVTETESCRDMPLDTATHCCCQNRIESILFAFSVYNVIFIFTVKLKGSYIN